MGGPPQEARPSLLWCESYEWHHEGTEAWSQGGWEAGAKPGNWALKVRRRGTQSEQVDSFQNQMTP